VVDYNLIRIILVMQFLLSFVDVSGDAAVYFPFVLSLSLFVSFSVQNLKTSVRCSG